MWLTAVVDGPRISHAPKRPFERAWKLLQSLLCDGQPRNGTDEILGNNRVAKQGRMDNTRSKSHERNAGLDQPDWNTIIC